MSEMGQAILLSVVSHGQAHHVWRLFRDLDDHCQRLSLAVTLTLNIDETLPFGAADFSFPVRIIRNPHPQGFAENHNAAFKASFSEPADYFCVVNPDVRIQGNVFDALTDCLRRESGVGVVAPLVRNLMGGVEDSARLFPTPLTILFKTLGFKEKLLALPDRGCVAVDWVAGMFMLFPGKIFAEMGGFDERYFLYYEDVDICCRLRLAGLKVMLVPGATVIHDARRDSHRRIKYFIWHLTSMLRFFISPVFFRRWRQIRHSRRKEQPGG